MHFVSIINQDAHEELTFKVRFGTVEHGNGDQRKHVQAFEVRRATGDAALRGAAGELIVDGHTNEVAGTGSGVRVFAGLVPDLFAGDAAALGVFRNALFKDNKFDRRRLQ